jgi:CBS domain-containing protein
MRDQNIGFLPVCEANMKVIGTVTDRDITIRAVAEGLPSSTPVDALMTSDVVACSSDDDLESARELMAEHQKSRIMCVSTSGRLEGIISLSDLAQLDEGSSIDTLRHVSSREARGDADWARS